MASHSPAGDPSELAAAGWSVWARRAASVLILWHVTATFIAPWRMTSGGAPLVENTYLAFRWYLDATFLNHGYGFFAPDPTASHLIRYELVLADGGKLVDTFPNLKNHWPRLIYHRHFMLSESLARDFAQANPPEEIRNHPDNQERLREVRAALQVDLRAIARRLMTIHNARQVDLYLVRHELLSPEEVSRGRRIDDPRTYVDIGRWTFSADTIDAP